MNPLDVSPANIWEYAQNRPELIERDLEVFGVPQDITARILLARGVYKWFRARRDLIWLKDEWRDELTRLYRAIECGEIKRGSAEHLEAKGRIKALESCRKEVRRICHSPRWQDVERRRLITS